VDFAKPKRLLIVEDSVDLQALLSRLFSSEGFSLLHAENGQEALDILRNSSELPSAILLDIMMPVMDGFEFLEARAKDPRIAAIPVVAMSADANSQNRSKQLQANAFVQKPVHDIGKLIALIESL
jgi:CheY-like chemotaxis protein